LWHAKKNNLQLEDDQRQVCDGYDQNDAAADDDVNAAPAPASPFVALRTRIFGDFEILSANTGTIPTGTELSFIVSVSVSITGREVSSFPIERVSTAEDARKIAD
jgi:hypothetical protein